VAVTLERPPQVANRPPHAVAIGPALGPARLPLTSVTVSTVIHVALAVAIFLALSTFAPPRPQPMVVNLVPAVAAIGSPRGDASVPPEPTLRPEPPAPRRQPPAPPAPAPKAALPAPPRPLPAPTLPSRERPRESLPLSEPSALVQRTTAAALPRFEARELPTLPAASASAARNPLPPAPMKGVAETAVSASPPLPLGRADGSPRGAGAVTAEGDFPYAWYIAAIQRKISEQWQEKALPGRQPTVMFEIARDGAIHAGVLAVAKSSGNPRYDRAAVRAIEDARPFPPLPPDFKESLLRINVSFDYIGDGMRAKP
jgi:colicin import membrane protein